MPTVPAKKKKNGQKTAASDRLILYPEVRVDICQGDGALTAEQARQLLVWETDEDYAKRMGSDKVKFEEPLLKDEFGRAVVCWNNTKNRPFSESWSRQLSQDILNRNWRFNLETIVISRTGEVTSGQHRLIALVLASQTWEKNKGRWEKNWPTEPVIETLVAFGGSEDASVLRTVDNVRPRTLSDVFYTSPLFRDMKSGDRKECSRMLDAAVDMLFRRTQASERSGQKYQTHSTSMEFLDRHKRLLDCVKHLYEENKERAISVLKLSPGACAAAMYLMAASDTDGDVYRNAQPFPSEKAIDVDWWDKASDFFVALAAKDPALNPVRKALGALVDEETGLGGRATEKFCVLAKAWNLFKADQKLTEEDCSLIYRTDGEGIKHLDEHPDFGGIDLGEKHREPEDEPTPEEVEAAKKKIKDERAAELNRKAEEARAAKANNQSAGQEVFAKWESAKEERPNFIILFRSKTGGAMTYGSDADKAARLAGCKLVKNPTDPAPKVLVPATEVRGVLDKLVGAGQRVAVIGEVLDASGKRAENIEEFGEAPAQEEEEKPTAPRPGGKKPPKAKAGK